MALCGPAAVPEQLQGGIQREPVLAPPTMRPRLPREALGRGLALPLLLPITGQLSKGFVVQHIPASFPGFEE